MAIAFNSATTNSAASGSSITVTHTAAGDNRLAIIGVLSLGQNITALTYDGVSCLGNVVNTLNFSGRYLTYYYLVAPSTTVNATISCTFAANVTSGIVIQVATYTGVDQTNPINATNTTSTSSGTSLTCPITTTVDNCWLAGFGYFNDGTVPTASTGTTKRTTSVYRNSYYDTYDSNGAKTPVGEYSLGVQVAVATYIYILGAALAPASEVTVTGIAVKTAPTKVTYNDEENLDLTGLEVTLTYSDESTLDVGLADFVANGITTNPINGAQLSTADTEVTITHTDSSEFTTQAITVNPIVSSIEVKTPPTKVTYYEGNSLNLNGLVITLNWSDLTTEDVAFADFVANGISTDPENGATLTLLDTLVTITHDESQEECTQEITVSEAPVSSKTTSRNIISNSITI